MGYRDLAAQLIRKHEGYVAAPYEDSVGKLTIGIGHNLSDKPLCDAAIQAQFEHDLADAERDAIALVPGFFGLNDARKAALVDMSFNLGRPRLATFKNTLKAIQDGRWEDAAKGMLASRWAKQVGKRATRLAEIMRTGQV